MTTKAHIKISGTVKNPLFKLLGKVKAHAYGLDKIDFNEHPSGHVEVFVTGKREKIWDVINWVKKGNVFIKVSEITFRFKDLG